MINKVVVLAAVVVVIVLSPVLRFFRFLSLASFICRFILFVTSFSRSFYEALVVKQSTEQQKQKLSLTDIQKLSHLPSTSPALKVFPLVQPTVLNVQPLASPTL